MRSFQTLILFLLFFKLASGFCPAPFLYIFILYACRFPLQRLHVRLHTLDLAIRGHDSDILTATRKRHE